MQASDKDEEACTKSLNIDRNILLPLAEQTGKITFWSPGDNHRLNSLQTMGGRYEAKAAD